MDLESQVLEFLEKNPDKDFSIVEIITGVYRIKPSKMLLIEHYSKIWDVFGALNSLYKKGKVDMKLSSLRYTILYQVKKT